MFDLVVIDVVIGLIFIYLLYSLLATVLQEIVATNLSFRAKVLEKAVMRMLDDGDSNRNRILSFLALIFVKRGKQPKMTALFYKHPLIKYLSPDTWQSKPSYLSAQNFSKVVVDLLRGRQEEAGKDYRTEIEAALKDKRTSWDKVKISPDTSDYLNSIWVDAQGDIDKFRTHLEDWYNETMDRASGWYKQYTQVILMIIGFTLAMLFNVDTIQIVRKLEKDPKLREQLVTQADAFVKAHPNLVEELNHEKKRNEALAASLRDTTKKTGNTDSLNTISEQKYQALKAHRDSLFGQASKLLKEDIGKINNSLALGWGNYGGAVGWYDKVCFVVSSTFCNAMKFLGLFITAIAISLGAPFWFDLLNKLVKLRGAIKGEADKNKPDAKVEVVNVKRVG